MRFNTKEKRVWSRIDLLGNKDTQLENCVIENDQIRTRKGFYEKDAIFNSDNHYGFDMSFICTDCYIYHSGRYGRVTVSVVDNLMGSMSYNMRLAFTDGEVMDIGIIDFTAATVGVFGFPDSFTVFKGRPIAGSGIYFIVRLIYSGETPDRVRVLELDTEMKTWYPVENSNIYHPTVLSLGRGENYYNATHLGERLKLPAPIKPESKNLLNGGFFAKYTADGASHSFKLPYDNIDDEIIRCEFVWGQERYEWSIYGGSEHSEANTFNGAKIFMSCDRENGRVFFSNSNGTMWAPPYTGDNNNLSFRAYKTVMADQQKVTSMRGCKRLDGDAMINGSNVSVFYKSSLYPSLTLVNSPRSPLYFPEDAQMSLGESSKEVLGVYTRGKYALAIKEGEVFVARIKQYNGYALVSTAEESKKNSGVYSIVFEKATDLPKAPVPNSVGFLENEIIFSSQDGGVYTLSLSGFECKKIGKLKSMPQRTFFGVAVGDLYLFVNGNRAETVQKYKNSYVFGQWTLPKTMINGFNYLGETVLFAESTQGEYGVWSVCIGGNEDALFIDWPSSSSLTTYPINTVIRFSVDDLQPGAKKLFALRLEGACKEVCLSLLSANKKLCERIAAFKENVAYIPVPIYAQKPVVEIRFNKTANINKIDAEYKILNKL
jgi:hypothetical protein